ncbi:unnamed protein product [Lupinus luteus]|uniref:Uncharacterized protein n=1 Tax=Lupinus luteus TaxID=3873 RepID=A0AAV1XXH4_LUPLU
MSSAKILGDNVDNVELCPRQVQILLNVSEHSRCNRKNIFINTFFRFNWTLDILLEKGSNMHRLISLRSQHKEGFGVDPGLPFLPYLPYESNSIYSYWSVPNLMQRTTQYPQSASTMVWRLVRMIGIKSPHPFSMDFPAVPTFNYKMPTPSDMRTNATISCGNGSRFNFDAGNSTFRNKK